MGVDERAESLPLTRKQSFPLWLCFFAVVINYSDRANMAIVSIPMQKEFHWSHAIFGAVNGAYLAGYLPAQFVAGALADRVGQEAMLLLSVFGWSFFTFLTPLVAWNFYAIYAVRAMMGFCEGFCFPALHSIIATRCPEDRQSAAVSLLTSGSYLGTAVTTVLAPPVVHYGGWPSVFHVCAIFGALWMVFWIQHMKMQTTEAIDGPFLAREGVAPDSG
jgi:ACS family sodium-dependent inorganic phosphate cotransporter